jgi:hypothetical protein
MGQGQEKKDDFIFHDTRHCFNTYALKASVPERVIMAITGRSTLAMLSRCNTFDNDNLYDAVRQVGSHLQETSETIGQELLYG